MRIITTDADRHLAHIVHAISLDRESWKGWQYAHIETLSVVALSKRTALFEPMTQLLHLYLDHHDASIFVCDTGEVHIFSKGISGATFNDMCVQILNLIQDSLRIAAYFSIYNISADYEGMLALYNRKRTVEAAIQYIPTRSHDRNEIKRYLAQRVLLVEDDPVTRWLVKNTLQDRYQLSIATDAKSALEIYRTQRPDVVLLDIGLPDADGRVAMEKIITSDPAAHVIMFSSNDSLDNIAESLERGAKSFLSKPFTRERLLECVESAAVA